MKHLKISKITKVACVLLSMVLLISTVSVSAFASTSTTKYAYSVGCNHGSWAWLLGGLEGNFTGNVDYAATCYGMMSGFTSYKNYAPDYAYMRGNNPNGTRRIASDVVFLNGHANYNCLVHNHNNNNGVYATGVYIGTDDYTSDSGYKYVGLESTNMSTCDHISFVGCSTASNGNTNITWKAVNKGATSALGFTDSIHSRTSAGEGWLKKYNDALANGYTISRAITYANSFYSSSDLGTYAKIYGSSSNTVTSSSKNNFNEFFKENTSISCAGICNVENAPVIESSRMISEIITNIRKLDATFETSKYKMTVNMFAPQDGNGMITFSYYIGDYIHSNKAFVAIIENNCVVEVLANDVVSKGLRGELTLSASESKLIALANAHKNSFQLETVDDYNVVKTTENYYFDFNTGKLVYEGSVFYTDPAADGAIFDKTVENILN